MMKVAVCGLTSSGKSTLAKAIAEHFSLKYYSAGSIFRDYASKHNLSLDALSKQAPEKLDEIIDSKTKFLCEHENNFVIEGRLTCYFCKNAVKIYLHAPLKVRAKRLSERESMSYEQAYAMLKSRDEFDLKRYAKLYGIEDYESFMKNNVDLVIDTEKNNIEQMIALAIKFLEHKNI